MSGQTSATPPKGFNVATSSRSSRPLSRPATALTFALVLTFVFVPARAEVASAAEGGGYWMADAAGVVTAFGDAAHHGDLRHTPTSATIVDLAPHPDGNGYWLLSDSGEVFGFGAAIGNVSLTSGVRFHSGGTDANGCHAGSRPYHCHGGGTPAPTVPVTTSPPTTAAPAAPALTCAQVGHRVYVGHDGYHPDLDRDGDGVGCEAWPEYVVSGFEAPERWTALAAHPSGEGFWTFSSHGRVDAFGVARSWGDVAHLDLAGPVVAAAATPSGDGYYLLGSDGGVFTFGDAVFAGSMGAIPLDRPAVGLIPDPDGFGYWFVAADGGVFAFDAPFVGSIPGVLPPGVQLDQPINGMVPYGNGYLMVAFDGGVFNFATDLDFVGSLAGGGAGVAVVAVAAPSSGPVATTTSLAATTTSVPLTTTTPVVSTTASGVTTTFPVIVTTAPAPTTTDAPVSPTTSAADVDSPVLVAVDVDRDTLDVRSGSVTLTVELHVEDASGLASPGLVLSLGSQDTDQSAGFGAATRISGDAHSGRYRWSATVDEQNAAGSWSILLFPMSDVLGNTGDFETLGIVEVIAGAGDVSAPQLESWSISHEVLDVSGGAATIQVSLVATDASGIRPPSPVLVLSSLETTQSVGFGPAELVTGDRRSATYTWSATVTTGSARGSWAVELFPMADEIGNTADGFVTLGEIEVVG